jgi:uncharacterized cupin superfamily protein
VSDGWYVVNARDREWFDRGPRGAVTLLVDGDARVGVNLFVLGPGEPMAMYHWEADQEGYLVVSGEGLAIVDDREVPLKQWDYVHTPPGVPHVIIGGPCVVLAIGGREHQSGPDWGGYPLSDAAARHNASTETETSDPKIAYARFPARRPCTYREGWLD